jgi:hypothetical protein
MGYVRSIHPPGSQALATLRDYGANDLRGPGGGAESGCTLWGRPGYEATYRLQSQSFRTLQDSPTTERPSERMLDIWA